MAKAAREFAPELRTGMAFTGAAAITGFLASLMIGTLIAIAFSQSSLIRTSCFPYAIFLQTVPIMAIAPLIVIWFGTGFHSVVLVAFIISLFPIITLLANLLPFLVGGSVIIETIFQIPGMGWLAYEAVLEREYDLVMATLLLSAVLTLFGILLSDILYALVDPRVSFEGRR